MPELTVFKLSYSVVVRPSGMRDFGAILARSLGFPSRVVGVLHRIVYCIASVQCMCSVCTPTFLLSRRFSSGWLRILIGKPPQRWFAQNIHCTGTSVLIYTGLRVFDTLVIGHLPSLPKWAMLFCFLFPKIFPNKTRPYLDDHVPNFNR